MYWHDHQCGRQRRTVDRDHRIAGHNGHRCHPRRGNAGAAGGNGDTHGGGGGGTSAGSGKDGVIVIVCTPAATLSIPPIFHRPLLVWNKRA